MVKEQTATTETKQIEARRNRTKTQQKLTGKSSENPNLNPPEKQAI
jgi:hypothetical protein